MGKCILMMDGKFMQWTSVTDSPVTPLLPEPLFAQFWKDEYGRSGMVDYENLMEIAKERGCSSYFSTTDEVLKHNQAGEDGKKLTKAQIIAAYTMTDMNEFLEWSNGRTKEFMNMAAEFGPQGRKERKK